MSNPTMFANVGGKMIDVRVFPIQIRPDCVVRVFGIPHDLSRAEAEKIGRVVGALAQVDTLPKGRDAKQARCASKGSAIAKRCAHTLSNSHQG